MASKITRLRHLGFFLEIRCKKIFNAFDKERYMISEMSVEINIKFKEVVLNQSELPVRKKTQK